MSANPPQVPPWIKILEEIRSPKPPGFDSVRRARLAQMQQLTGRAVIVHASACTVPSKILPPQSLMLDFADIKSFETAAYQLPAGPLGPIAPQLTVGNMVASADAILSQFQQIRDEILGNASRGIQPDPSKINLWGPVLATMGPALLVQCENAKQFGRQLVISFLCNYMFAGDAQAQATAQG